MVDPWSAKERQPSESCRRKEAVDPWSAGEEKNNYADLLALKHRELSESRSEGAWPRGGTAA